MRAVCDELLRGAGADWWNVAGFSVDAVPESVAERARVSWRRIVAELDQHEPWVVKEPRLCLLLPLLLADLRSPASWCSSCKIGMVRPWTFASAAF